MVDRLAPSSRHIFRSADGKAVYSWDQTLSEVDIFVDVPPGVKAKALFCKITTDHLSFGLHGNPPFLDLDLGGTVKVRLPAPFSSCLPRQTTAPHAAALSAYLLLH